MNFTVGSLFDGSGGFPLAAFMCGGVPVWASEIEPYPIAVTKSRFPYVKHLGDVSKIKGNEIDPVDVVSFGSPCQDLSVAGLRKGLKHEDNGDDETTRSGLFMEAVRIIKEMREATNGRYPTFAVWENVPGAFSSNKGEDFRIVLEELIKIVEPSTIMPAVPKNGWSYADCYVGDGWSLAYRVFDAQHWGVPQRRKRVYALLDLRGERALEILFKREGLRGYFEEGRTPWEGVTSDVERSAVSDDSERNSVTYGFPLGFRPENTRVYEEVATTLCNGTRAGFCNGVIVPVDALPFDTTQVTSPYNYSNPQWGDPCHPLAAGAHPPSVICKCYDARSNGDGNISPTITGDHNNRITDYTSVVVEPTYIIDGDKLGKAERAGGSGLGVRESDKMYTLTAKDVHSVCYANPPSLIVRRITPTECARLQGFPDEWGHPDKKDDFTEDEYQFWLNVRKTHDKINGRKPKDYAKKQILAWYNKLHTDSSEYKLWGNGIALPNALYVMQGIADTFN